MLIYYLLIVAIIFFGIFLEKKHKKTYAIIVFIMLTLIAGLRKYTIGNDTGNYVSFFNKVILYGSNIFKTSRFEVAYVLFNFIISKISSNYTVLLFFAASITNACICQFVYKYSKNMTFSFLLFIVCRFFFSEMNIIREFLAIAIVLYSIKYIENRKIVKYILMIIIASMFHVSALVAVVLYFLYGLDLSKKNRFYLILATGLCYVFLYDILTYVTSSLGTYTLYVQEYYNSNELANILLFLISVLVFVFVSFIKNKKEVETDKNDILLYNISFVNVLLNFLAIRISILSRVSTYFDVFSIVLIANYIAKLENKRTRALCYILVFVGFLCYCLTITYLRPNWNHINPYMFYWQ